MEGAMDTVGSLVDKLVTVRLKQGANTDPEVDQDLGQQADRLVEEMDEVVGKMVEAAKAGQPLDNGAFVQRKRKTY